MIWEYPYFWKYPCKRWPICLKFLPWHWTPFPTVQPAPWLAAHVAGIAIVATSLLLHHNNGPKRWAAKTPGAKHWPLEPPKIWKNQTTHSGDPSKPRAQEKSSHRFRGFHRVSISMKCSWSSWLQFMFQESGVRFICLLYSQIRNVFSPFINVSSAKKH